MTASNSPKLLLDAIRNPRMMRSLSLANWERLLASARRNAVLAYLAESASAAGILDEVPERPRAAMRSAQAAAARLSQLARWELERVRRALVPAGIPIIALKGIAYVLRGLPHATTRLLSDIDIMVPADRIDVAERALLNAGWRGTKLDAYDQTYYRRWSHEIPPLQFPGRLLAVDVHHTICPPASRLHPDPQRFWTASEESDVAGVGLLCPADSVLHAAIHLFFDSDFDSRFRDLVDLHVLTTTFASQDPQFWTALVERAREQGLGRPLYYALETLRTVLETPIPESTRLEIRAFKPRIPVDGWMTRTLRKVLTPVDPAPWPPEHRFLLWLMYVRSHWLRMPPLP
ncbi:MAG TPA: nucleotidyltransferase family protein, partial [Casimicrobiaceae bacterium]